MILLISAFFWFLFVCAGLLLVALSLVSIRHVRPPLPPAESADTRRLVIENEYEDEGAVIPDCLEEILPIPPDRHINELELDVPPSGLLTPPITDSESHDEPPSPVIEKPSHPSAWMDSRLYSSHRVSTSSYNVDSSEVQTTRKKTPRKRCRKPKNHQRNVEHKEPAHSTPLAIPKPVEPPSYSLFGGPAPLLTVQHSINEQAYQELEFNLYQNHLVHEYSRQIAAQRQDALSRHHYHDHHRQNNTSTYCPPLRVETQINDRNYPFSLFDGRMSSVFGRSPTWTPSMHKQAEHRGHYQKDM